MNNVSFTGDEHIKDLSETIAKLIAREKDSSSLDKLYTSIVEIRARLETLELTIPKMKETALLLAHPSQDRFQIADAGVESSNGDSDDKVCPFEPGGKTCDHCSMCSSRGF